MLLKRIKVNDSEIFRDYLMWLYAYFKGAYSDSEGGSVIVFI
jgi:hypothetical protein